jgi:VIT1/CCC1 family predicted Fe2+/Mn2+ transporter
MAQLEHSHDHDSIRRRIRSTTKHSYLRDFVYGAIDGTVTTFAVVSGVAGAGLNPQIVIVLGLANLIGDGFSMAASNFLGTRTDEQLREKAREMERRHIRDAPEGERQEVREIFAEKGFTGQDLEKAVQIITSDQERWIDTMLVDELGMTLDGPSAFKAAATTFGAFCVVGILPLLVFIYGYFFPMETKVLYVASAILTAIAFFLVGAAKSKFVDQKWYWAGMETLSVGGIAAMLAYAVGVMLKGIAG